MRNGHLRTASGRRGEAGENGSAIVVLIGPLPIAGDIVGGTKVSFASLLFGLQSRRRYRVEVINISRASRGKNGMVKRWLNARGMAHMLWRLWQVARCSHVVMWNVSPGGAIRAVPFIHAICLFHRRPLVVRLFGGDFDEFYERSSRLERWLADRSLLCVDLVLLQTRALVERFKNIARVEWFPTTRDVRPRTRPLPTRCLRFIFVGQLRPQKGIREILGASRSLSSDVKINIAGPTMDGFDVACFDDHPRVRYLGALAPEDIPNVLEAHDALLFPSYYEGEGYPGAVLEAFQMGLPVIATEWKALPELVEHEKNGLLVPPRDEKALGKAMKRLVDEQRLFHLLQCGAKRQGEAFRDGYALERLESWFDELIGR